MDIRTNSTYLPTIATFLYLPNHGVVGNPLPGTFIAVFYNMIRRIPAALGHGSVSIEVYVSSAVGPGRAKILR